MLEKERTNEQRQQLTLFDRRVFSSSFSRKLLSKECINKSWINYKPEYVKSLVDERDV